MYFETPRKNNRKNRSTSKVKGQPMNSSQDKNLPNSKDKENNFNNNKNGGSSQILNNSNSSKIYFNF